MRLMWVLWPSFLAAGVAETFVFACVDPLELYPFSAAGEATRVAVYTLGFFCFWTVSALSSGLTLYLAGVGGTTPQGPPPASQRGAAES